MSFEEEEKRYQHRQKLFHLALLGGTFIICVWLLGVVGFLLWIPLMAWYLSRYLVNYAAESFDDLRWDKYGHKGGSFHAFDDREVRLFCDNSGICHVAVNDVFKVLEAKMTRLQYRKLAIRFAPEDCFVDREGVWWFSERAAAEWLGARASRIDKKAMRFKRWLEREVFPPMRRKHELGIEVSPPWIPEPRSD